MRCNLVKKRIERSIIMQRKFLEDLGLEKSVVDKILNENGADIEKAKSRLETERDNYKSQLETAQTALKKFEGVNVDELKGEIEKLNGDLATKETEYQTRIADMEFNSVLDGAISESGAKNAKAVKALLDLENLKTSKNQADDIKKALEQVKSENGYMFGSDEPFQNPVGATDTGNGGTGSNPLASMRAAMGLSAEKK
jgi:hypothetical protein